MNSASRSRFARMRTIAPTVAIAARPRSRPISVAAFITMSMTGDWNLWMNVLPRVSSADVSDRRMADTTTASPNAQPTTALANASVATSDGSSA